MKHKLLLLLIFIPLPWGIHLTLAQESMPCLADAENSDTELRAFGVGKGENAFEALNAAVNNAMSKLKPRCAELYPNRKFEYSIMAKSTTDGEEIELDTTIGQPTIICNEIAEASLFTAYIVISFDISPTKAIGNEE